jgi:hypothetical protein
MMDSIPVALHQGIGGEEQDVCLEEYVRKAKECVLMDMNETRTPDTGTYRTSINIPWWYRDDISSFTNRMLIDMSASYPFRL